MSSAAKHLTQRGADTRIWVGTSGWSYDDWRGSFYPQTLPKKQWLPFYATRFATAEINASFYRTPTLEAVELWRTQTPRDFAFAWKASKFMTHWKRLSPKCKNSLALMQTRLAVLAPKVGVVLFQLPRRFTKDAERLQCFIGMLPSRARYAFEFRDKSWYADDIYDLLHNRDVALCISDHVDAPAPWLATARHVYVRGHGPSGRYHGSYSVRTLRRWTQEVLAWRSQRRTVFVYFDNDQKAAAPKNALQLLAMIGKEVAVARTEPDAR